MAGTGTKRIIELTEASTIQNGDFIAVDSNARGTKKVSTDTLATSAALTAETNARTGADEQMSERMDGIEEQTALIQNPTKMLSGALVSFTDGADMPMVACTAEIVPKQSGSGTPSPDNVRPISGWTEVNSIVSDEQLFIPSATVIGENWIGGDASNRAINSFSVEPNTDYRVITKGGNFSNVLFVQKNNSSQIRSHSIKPYFQSTITTAENCNRVIIQFESDGDMSESNFLGFVCSVAKTSNLHTINLGRAVYGGTLDVVTGVLTDKMAIVDLGSLSWSYQSAWGSWYTDYVADMKGTNTGAETPNFISDRFTTIPTNEGLSPQAQGYTGISSTVRGSSGCRILVKNGSTTEPPTGQLCYELAEPQTYQLTPTEVNTLLGENNVWADSGDVEITYRRDISIVLENLENALSGSNSLNTMMMSAPTENTAEEPTEDEVEDDMR